MSKPAIMAIMLLFEDATFQPVSNKYLSSICIQMEIVILK